MPSPTEVKMVIAATPEGSLATPATTALLELLTESGPLVLRVSKSVVQELMGELRKLSLTDDSP